MFFADFVISTKMKQKPEYQITVHTTSKYTINIVEMTEFIKLSAWMTDDQTITLCGEFTICVNILKFIPSKAS